MTSTAEFTKGFLAGTEFLALVVEAKEALADYYSESMGMSDQTIQKIDLIKDFRARVVSALDSARKVFFLGNGTVSHKTIFEVLEMVNNEEMYLLKWIQLEGNITEKGGPDELIAHGRFFVNLLDSVIEEGGSAATEMIVSRLAHLIQSFCPNPQQVQPAVVL